MKKLKLYLDTSVISHLDQQDAFEKMQDTLKLWEEIKIGLYDIYLSYVDFEELMECSAEKRKTLADFNATIDYTLIEYSDEINLLAGEFIKYDILKQSSFDDAQHLACAMISECNAVVSWNFKHMVNIKTIKGVRVVAALTGYRDVPIYTPSMLLGGNEDDS
ncbi:MAG: PIN domain nuclease [Oscillospiraceae bacterium]|nr:PIN domain nuclease [Oscillospiraceae bacterium]